MFYVVCDAGRKTVPCTCDSHTKWSWTSYCGVAVIRVRARKNVLESQETRTKTKYERRRETRDIVARTDITTGRKRTATTRTQRRITNWSSSHFHYVSLSVKNWSWPTSNWATAPGLRRTGPLRQACVELGLLAGLRGTGSIGRPAWNWVYCQAYVKLGRCANAKVDRIWW